MDIDGRFYCSKCMREIKEETVCPYCHYDHMNEKNQSPALEAGTFLNNRYQLGSVIGQGGFGITYAAWDETLDIPVAVKEYFPAELVTRDTDYSDEVIVSENNRGLYFTGMQHFLRESRVLAMMKGLKGVVNVQDYFEENETAYIVMEFIQGISLGEYSKAKKPDVKAFLTMMKEPIDALITLHKQGVLHRDINPSNLLVQEDGTVKLIDFGAATKMKKDQSMIVVTRQYAPIEQYQSEDSKLGAWTDVYGLAATMYEALTGIVPQESIARMHRDELKPIDQTDAKLKTYQAKAIMQGLAVSPGKRTQSMEEFRARLYNLPLPEEVLLRKKFMRKVSAAAACIVIGVILAAVNFTVGLPLGCGLMYILKLDGWHVSDCIQPEESLIIPESRLGLPVVSIDDYALNDCDVLETVVLPDRMKSVGSYALANCDQLRSVMIPKRVDHIEETSFENTSRYMTIWGENDSYTALFAGENGLAFAERDDYEVEENEDGTVSLVSYSGDDESVVLPSLVDGKKVTALYQSENSDIEFGISPKVTELFLPEYLTEIPYSMFYSYRSTGTFSREDTELHLEKLIMNDHLEKISHGGIGGCPLKEVVFSENLQVIDISAMSGITLPEMILPESVKEIRNFAFSGSEIKKAVLPSAVEVWGNCLFLGCEYLQEVDLPDNMPHIPEGMFYYCRLLEEIKLPENIEFIGKEAFAKCEVLQCIKIPEGTRSIEEYAFADCYELKYIDIPESVEYIHDTVFDGCPSNLVIGGYAGSYAEEYAREHNICFDDKGQWSEGISFFEPGILQIIDSKEKNPVLPTYDWVNNKVVYMVISLNLYAEHETVRLPLHVEKLGDSLFQSGYSLKKIVIPEGTKVIFDSAFACVGLEEIVIPDSVEVMEPEIFYACENLKKAYIGKNVGALKGAFRFCENLEEVYIYGENTTIDATAFQNCNKLTIYGYEGSEAEKYAQEYGIPFVSCQ